MLLIIDNYHRRLYDHDDHRIHMMPTLTNHRKSQVGKLQLSGCERSITSLRFLSKACLPAHVSETWRRIRIRRSSQILLRFLPSTSQTYATWTCSVSNLMFECARLSIETVRKFANLCPPRSHPGQMITSIKKGCTTTPTLLHSECAV